MYGPPADPRQILAPVLLMQTPLPYLLCVVVGLAITALAWWRRPPLALRAWCFVLGQTIALTMPLLVFLDTYWYGSFPTIDKQGSLLFYLDGVHVRMLLHPVASLRDPAAALIGVHTGHLWPVQLFDVILSPMGSFNLMALLSPALAWWAAWLLLYELSGDARGSMVLAFAWGMGLHVFRDLNWYTIEKAGIFWLALYALALVKSWRLGGRWPWIAGALFVAMALNNLYLAMVGSLAAALAAFVDLPGFIRKIRHHEGDGGSMVAAAALSAVAASPLVIWQALLMRDGPSLATPEQFLWQRAALDSFTLSPLQWNRLEAHRALNLVGLGLALVGLARGWRDRRVRFLLLVAVASFAVSLGPLILPKLPNPLYLLLFHVVPGFWRIAKPETFFHATWLALLAIAAIELARWRGLPDRQRLLNGLYVLFVLVWVLMVRTHPAYPPMTLPVDGSLAPDWADRVFPTGPATP